MAEKQPDAKQLTPPAPETEEPKEPEEGRLRSHGPDSWLDDLGFLPDEKARD